MSKYNRINDVLGYELETNEGGAFLQDQELQRIERNLQNQATLTQRENEANSLQDSVNSIQNSLSSLQTNLQGLGESITALQTGVEDLNTRVDVIENATAGGGRAPALPVAASDPAGGAEEMDNDPVVAAAEEIFQKSLKAERREW